MKTYVAFTVDVDPDLNMPVNGRKTPVKYPAMDEDFSFEAAEQGTAVLATLLDSIGIAGTFFFEARTADVLNRKIDLNALMKRHEVACHGYQHENFTGEKTGIPISEHERRDIIGTSLKMLRAIFNREIRGFRAPYLQIDKALMEILDDFGFVYDSSDTAFVRDPIPIVAQRVVMNERGRTTVLEIPLSEWLDADDKKMSSYLWALHEGKRMTQEYVTMIERAARTPNDGIIVIATHAWHLSKTFALGELSDEGKAHSVKQIRYILERIKKINNVSFIRLDEYARNILSQEQK